MLGRVFFGNFTKPNGGKIMVAHLNSRFLTEREVSELTSFSVFTLRNHRHLGRGIPYLKVGRSVRYLLKDVEYYMERQRIVPGQEQ
jgi:hypothetical protein